VQRLWNPLNVGDGWDELGSYPNTYKGILGAISHARNKSDNGDTVVLSEGDSMPGAGYDGSGSGLLLMGWRPTLKIDTTEK